MNVSWEWPIVILIIALVFIPFFRRQISELIGRITALWGVKADQPATQPKPRDISRELPNSPTQDPTRAPFILSASSK